MSFSDILLYALGTIFYLIRIETSEGHIGGVNGGAALEGFLVRSCSQQLLHTESFDSSYIKSE